jgi:glycosyltransferase involved in cell wall biosynthesis
MRILSLSEFYPPVIGGLERHVQSLSRELVRRGHHVAVATLQRPGSPAEEMDDGVHVYRIGGFSRVLKPFYESTERPFHPTVPDPGMMATLYRVIKLERPEIVHGRGWIIYSALPLKRLSGAAVVVTLHDYALVCPKRTFLHQGRICSGPGYGKCVRCAAEPMGLAKSLAVTSGLRLSSPLHGEVDRFIAISRAVAQASGCAARGRQVDVVPSLVPDRIVEIARTAPRPAFVPPQDDYLLFVGGLGHSKGLDVLIAAHAKLARRLPLVVIATPPVRDAPSLPRDVTLIVGAEHDVVMGAWAHCALGVVPSVGPEAFGQVAVEAMACGKAVVASDTGGLSDIVVDGETGLLVPPGDPIALRLAIDDLLADAGRREAMGAAGRDRARRFFASAVAAQVEGVYLDVLAERMARRSVRGRTDP